MTTTSTVFNTALNVSKNITKSALIAAVLLTTSSSLVVAQTATTTTEEKQETKEIAKPDSKKWLKLCNTLDDGKKACFMRQLKQNADVFAGSFVLRDDPLQKNRLLIVGAVPLGVLLPFGLTLQIDAQKPIRVPYLACDPQTCAAQLVINEAYINALKRGNTLKMTAKNRSNKDFVVEIDLAGFTASYDGEGIDLKTLKEQQAKPVSSETKTLEQKLADQAEQIRREKEAENAAKENAN